jgi:drug/metabolite transporter (DMT)-like permease
MRTQLKLSVIVSLALLYLVWGSTFLSVRILLDYFPPLVITFSRNFLAGSLLGLISILGGFWKPISRKHLRIHLMAGVFLILGGNGFMALAGSIVPSGFSSVFMALGPLFLVALFWINGKKPSFKKIIGTILGLVGILILSSSKSLAIPGKETEFLKGISFLTIGVIAWNFAVFKIQISGANVYHFTQTSFIQMIFGAFVTLIISYVMGDLEVIEVTKLPTKAYLFFFYLALVGSMFGFSLFAYLSKECDATLVATYTYVNPIFALLLGNIILGENLSGLLIFASVFILTAVVLITTDKPK